MRQLLIVAVALGLFAVEGKAEPRWLGGEGPPFAFAADVTGGMHQGDTLSLVVALGGRYPTPAMVTARVHIPGELGLVQGDTTITGPLEKVRGNWTFRIAPRQTGRYEVRGQVQIDAGTQGIDDAEFTMPVDVGADTVLVEHSRYLRLESRKDGQRFRYADWWLVPLDSAEAPVVEADFNHRGSRARAMTQTIAVCQRSSAVAALDSIRFVVVVGPDGQVRDLKLLGRRPRSEVAAAAEEALRKWTFEPARVNGAAVSDWIYVSVPVRWGS